MSVTITWDSKETFLLALKNSSRKTTRVPPFKDLLTIYYKHHSRSSEAMQYVYESNRVKLLKMILVH